MTRSEFINKVNEKLKLIRTERGFTQDKMADVLGISKKTLVQVEKGRKSLGWAVAIAVCVIFKDSEIVTLTFGEDVEDIIGLLSFSNNERKYNKTLGEQIWWKDIDSKNGYIIQQNIVSNNYRILDKNHERIYSSFEFVYILKRFNELTK